MIRWVNEWAQDHAGLRVIVVEDNPAKTFRISGVEHYAWRDIEDEMGKDSWIIPRRADAVCSFGFIKALQGNADIIWNLNDDCYPEEDIKGTYLDQIEYVFNARVPVDTWTNTVDGMYMRGYPYKIRDTLRPVMFHHGMWSNIPDLDGETQLNNPDFRLPPCKTRKVMPPGFFPMCNMNMMFRSEMAPVMYQLLMGKQRDGSPWGFDRFADIWSGLFMKKTADHLGYAVTSGRPSIHHSRASDPYKNVQLEAAGRVVHEDLWRYIRDVQLSESTPAGCYLQLADAINDYRGATPDRKNYWHSLAAAMRLWVKWSSE